MFQKIDLIITVFNKEKYISRALNSALSQHKYQFNKIIVVNDGSTDLSSQVLADYKKNNSKLQLINIKKSGVSIARNTGLKYSKAKYIVFLDADDELARQYLIEICRLIKFYPNCKIFSVVHQNVYAKHKIYDEDLIDNIGNLAISDNPIREFIFKSNIICSSGICLLKNEILRIQFPENIIIGEDIYVWLKLFSVNKLAWSGRSLVAIYKNALDRTQNSRFKEIPYFLKCKKEIVNTYKNKFWIELYFFLCFFKYYFQLNKKLNQDLLLLSNDYKFNFFLIKFLPASLLFKLYNILLLIRNKYIQ
jgi:glycosyltransferase involved in cell wall biosynthesis